MTLSTDTEAGMKLSEAQRKTLEGLMAVEGFTSKADGRSAHSLVTRGLADRQYCMGLGWLFKITKSGRALLEAE